MKDLTPVRIALLGGAILVGSVFGVLEKAGADDSVFFAIVLAVSISVGIWASPKGNIVLGLKRLWLFDWIAVALLPMFMLFVSPAEPKLIQAARSVCFFVFFLSGTTLARRFHRGKTVCR